MVSYGQKILLRQVRSMSNSVSIDVIVEGKTEVIFIKKVLAPYLSVQNIWLTPRKATKQGENGGDIKFSRVSKDIGIYLKEQSKTYITTMIDYYGTKSNWPGFDNIQNHMSPDDIATCVNSATKKAIDSEFSNLGAERRFIPYISMHESEALLFSDAKILATYLGKEEKEIQQIIDDCGSPEEINNSRETAPSKRLEKLSKSFKKTITGIRIAESIGIKKMREQCPQFNHWIKQLEALNS